MRTSALAKRAPSMWTATPCRCAIAQFADLGDPIDRAALGRLRQRQHARADVMRPAPWPSSSAARRVAGAILLPSPAHPTACAAAEELRRAAFVGRDMRFRVAQHRAPGRGRWARASALAAVPVTRNTRPRTRRRGEALLDPPGPVVVAVARASRCWLCGGRRGWRRDAGRVVASEVHALPRWPCALEQCNSVALHYRSMFLLLRAGKVRGNKRAKKADPVAHRLARMAGFRHIRTALLSQLTAATGGRRTAGGPVRDRRAADSRPSRRLGLHRGRCRERGRCADKALNDEEDHEHATVRPRWSEQLSCGADR